MQQPPHPRPRALPPSRPPARFLEAGMFNNSGGATISISYSIFDAPTNGPQTVSFQLAPLLPTKAGRTPREQAGPTALPPAPASLCPARDGAAAFPPRFLHHCPRRLILPGIQRLSPARDGGLSSLSRPLLISPANWLRRKPSQRGRGFEVAAVCRAPATSPSVCQIPAGRACSSGRERHASDPGVCHKAWARPRTSRQACD